MRTIWQANNPKWFTQLALRSRVFLVFLCLPLLLISGCGEPKKLSMGAHPWVGYEFLHLAARSPGFPENIQFTEFKNAAEIMQAIKADRLDIATLSLDEVLQVRADGVPMTIIAVLDYSVGADIFFTRPSIQDLADLKGKKIGLENSPFSQLILSRVLQQAGLTMEDIFPVYLPPNLHYQAWLNNELDSVISYQPYADDFIDSGCAQVFTSRQLSKTLMHVLAVRTDKLTLDSNALFHVASSHFEMIEQFKINPNDMLYRITNSLHESSSLEKMRGALKGVALPSLARNRALLTQTDTLVEAAQVYEPFIQFSHAPDRVHAKATFYEGLFSNQFLPGGK